MSVSSALGNTPQLAHRGMKRVEKAFRLQFAEILDVNEDRQGPYVKARVECADGVAIIRWGLDAITYPTLLQAFRSSLHAQPRPVAVKLLLDNALPGNEGSPQRWLSIRKPGGWVRVPFSCSPLFLANETWLRSVTTIQELLPLAWENPDEAIYRISQSARHRFRRPGLLLATTAVSVLMVGATSAFAYWYGNGQPPQVGATSPVQLSALAAVSSTRSTVHVVKNSPPGSIALAGPAQFSQTPPLLASTAPDDALPGDESLTNAVNNATPAAGISELYKVPDGQVALTFDDGPSQYTQQIVAELNRYHVHATFFFIGNRVSKWPNAVKDAVESGNVVGNHSENHADLVKLSGAGQANEVNACTQALVGVDGIPVKLFRPPYGAFNQETVQVLQQDHYTLALWNRDPRDWAAHDAQDIVHAVLSNHPSGGVFDLHDTRLTAEALPAIIDGLQKQNLKLVVLSPQ